MDEHFKAEEGHPHAFDRDRLGGRDGVRVAACRRISRNVREDCKKEFRPRSLRDLRDLRVRHPQFFNRLAERLRRIWKVAPAVLCSS